MDLNSQQISIIGAGIGGLTAALIFRRMGAEVTVYEQAEKISEVGAGIQISPNGGAVLAGLGLTAQLNQISMCAQAAELRDGVSGRSVLRLPLDGFGANHFYRFVHRADLIDLLLVAAQGAGVIIHTAHHIADIVFDHSGLAQVKMPDGRLLYPDLLIGADGLHSVVRRSLNGAQTPYFTQQVAWRCLVPLPQDVPQVATVYMGPGRHVVTYPLRQGQVMNVVAVEERTAWAEEGWHHEDEPKEMKAAFSGFAPEVSSLMDRVTNVNLWGLFSHPVAPVWARGKCAILGDAAHPTLPFLAQGGAMALEDAWALAACLSGSKNMIGGLRRYQSLRKPRTTKVVGAATQNARNYHLRTPVIRWGAHNVLRGIGAVAPSLMSRKFDWIYRYDVTQELPLTLPN